jgi:CP family cyanate transporter-like MFS transporter
VREADGRRPDWIALGLLWLAGVSLRVTLLAIPPVIPLIHDDLHLSETLVGALNGLPVLLLGIAAISGSLLLSRMGAVNALMIGLVLTGIGGALRGLGPTIEALFAMTFVMGLGVAIMQPVMPTLAGRWFPARVGLATAVYVNGLISGEIISAALTIPFSLPLVGGRWEWSLAFWSLPVLLTLLAIMAARRRGLVPKLAPLQRPRWWPDWRNGPMWCIGGILGFNSAVYFGTNAFLPDYLHAIGRPDLVGPGLSALNLGQLPSSFVLLAFADRFVGKRLPLAVLGAATALAVVAMLLAASGFWVVLMAGTVGFLCAFSLILTMSMPPLLAPDHDVHRFAAGQLAIGYALAFLVPVISGTVWDATHVPALAFLTIAASGVCVVALAVALRMPAHGK